MPPSSCLALSSALGFPGKWAPQQRDKPGHGRNPECGSVVISPALAPLHKTPLQENLFFGRKRKELFLKVGLLSEPREWVHWWHLRNSGSKWGQLRKRVPFTLYHVLTCPELWSCPCPSVNDSFTNTCGVTCVRRELQGALLGGIVQVIHRVVLW